jgi:MoaA/NifB/PqqE/SkfB family radical SAM enzyme
VEGVVRAWGKILLGYRPNLSIEITRECPLRCPGCYAYGDTHLGGGVTLRDVRDLKGKALVDGVIALVDKHKPLHLSIVGGEPLVRHRELTSLLPLLARRGVYTQVVTSAVRPIPREWASLRRLQICVSIDGLQPEHASGASLPPTIASSRTSSAIGSPSTARSRASKSAVPGSSKSSCGSGPTTRIPNISG